MKSAIILTALAGLVLGKPYMKNGIVYDAPIGSVKRGSPGARDLAAEALEYATRPSKCMDSYNLVQTGTGPSPTGNPEPDFDFYKFCSALIQSTVTSTTTSYYGTKVTVTAIVTVSTSSTATTTAIRTSTKPAATPTTTQVSYCPIPATGQSCGIPGWGYAENNLFATTADPYTCHQLCLANPLCKSFQAQDNTTVTPACNLYKTDASSNNTIVGASSPFTFYDRGCPDLLPAGCAGAAPAAATTKAATLDSTMTVTRVAPRAATVSIPWFLKPFGTVTLSEVCECILPTLAPAATVLAIQPVATYATLTTLRTSTKVVLYTVTTTSTVVVGGGDGGIYSTVA